MEDVVILSVKDILAILRRRLSIVVATVLVCVGVAGVLSYLVLPPVYRSETSLVVSNRQPTPTGDSVSYDQLQAYHALAVTYADIITSRAVLQDTIDTLRLPETVEQLAKMTAADVVGDTGVILVSVRDRDSTRAALIANTVASSFIDQLPRLLSRNDNVNVIDQAVPVTDQISPRPLLNIAVALAGSLMLGIVLAFLADFSDDTIHTSSDVRKLFGLRVLSVVPDVPAKTDHSGWGEGSRAFEAFSVLRTSLQFSTADHEPQVILATSCSAGEGKTTVAQNLAQSMSQVGNKVMIVDVNFVNPVLHRLFGIPNQQGLSSIATGGADFALFTRSEQYPNLCVVTSGPVPPNKAELLGSARLRRLMDRLREEYDIIVLDTPPVLAVTDAIVLSSLADGVILVVQADRTRAADLRSAIDALGAAHAKVLGVVLNATRRRRGDRSARSRRTESITTASPK